MKIRNIQLFKVRNIKSKHLSNLDVSDFIVQNNIKTQTQLLATANIQKKKGQKGFGWLCFLSYIKKAGWTNIPDLEDAKCSNDFTAAKKCRMDIVWYGCCFSVEIWLKMKVEPTYVYRHCFNVDKTTLKQHWQNQRRCCFNINS